MSRPIVQVSSIDAGRRAELEEAFRGVGLGVARGRVDERADIAVYLDGDHPTCTIADAVAADWVAATVEPLARAISSFRDFVSGSGRRARAAVVVTSTEGAIGLAGRSISAAVSAGLRGLLVTVVHEAPWLTGVLLVHPSATLDASDGAPDLPAGDGTMVGPDRDTLRWAASEISRIADDPSMLRPGVLITIAHEQIAYPGAHPPD